MGMIRTPAIRVAAIGIALLVLYMLSVFLRPQVVYVDKDTNEIVKDFQGSDMGGAINAVVDPPRKVQDPIKNNDKEHEQAHIQIEEAEINEATDQVVSDSSASHDQVAGVNDVYPGERVKATFVTLARNKELYDLIKSVRRVEDRFNRKFNYDWVFLNDEPFTDEFKKLTTSIVSGKTKYGLIPKEHWSYPDWIDKEKAAESRNAMKAAGIIYGDSESYRHMCRFESGFFWQNPLLDEYDWYWRVEPGIQIHCDLDYDLFKYMEDNNKVYGFTISIYEFEKTISSLWGHVKDFIKKNPQYLAEDNLMDFISDNKGETYNLCHFWSNFEVASLKFWRSQAYREFFDYLDKTGGFFYERWGDAPIHSIAAALFLSKDQVHYFEDVGYNHGVYTQCPLNSQFRYDHKCHCDPKSDFTFRGYSCGNKYYDVMKKEKPQEWVNYT
ncbi:DEHA2D15730p [Debaryomyces hansenii CBS767]|jgi:alpha 1,2-mannosyltransferase|uniref:DEHA2D15730p n=1 Tax=Debaryomyces hansenii (strain ATCC 36239 / CBS 767 / BCRC 21394 / JCM 1990 / NBRC 0083 / IGC 2968) TaxID=284592 RepID=Q6BRK2_DEBHA|nr:DEHA2D15730p [Debaryomyces hansenii CBS767]CAG87339.1 DEHA2D15730p [Debaryomyces hansenii CBS767]|eukprot:XP_459168.1 DEHA2D15730p [Debaryomyces hansenii CBS767]